MFTLWTLRPESSAGEELASSQAAPLDVIPHVTRTRSPGALVRSIRFKSLEPLVPRLPAICRARSSESSTRHPNRAGLKLCNPQSRNLYSWGCHGSCPRDPSTFSEGDWRLVGLEVPVVPSEKVLGSLGHGSCAETRSTVPPRPVCFGSSGTARGWTGKRSTCQMGFCLLHVCSKTQVKPCHLYHDFFTTPGCS